MRDNNKTVHMNTLFCGFLGYIIFVLLTEWLYFFSFVFGKHISYGIPEMLALAILFYIIVKTKSFVSFRPVEKEVLIASGLLLLAGGIISIFPDRGFDTFNYHLIAQNPAFRNYFTESYGYGNFQVWGFRLCDRMMYYFRIVFGYNWGTILNTLAIIISFTQIYSMLELLVNRTNRSAGKWELVVWSLLITLPLDVMMMVGSYYIDALYIPIGLEVIYFISYNDNKMPLMPWQLLYFASLCGLWLATKLTNIVFILPCIVCFVYFYRNSFSFARLCSCILIGIIPCMVYLVFNYICTGNPVFPYYNELFLSPYFSNSSFVDVRWGGENSIERLLWLFHLIFLPSIRTSEIFQPYDLLLFFGVCLSIPIAFFVRISRKKSKTFFSWQYSGIEKLFFIAIVSSILWGITTGYSRYFIFGRIVWGIIAFFCIKNYLFNKRIVINIIICLMAINGCYNGYLFFSGSNWSMNQYHLEQIGKELLDMKLKVGSPETGIGAYVITDHMSMGLIELLQEEMPVVNLSYPGPEEMADHYIDDIVSCRKKMCDLHKRNFDDIEGYLKQLNAHGLVVQSMSMPVETVLGKYLFVEIEKRNNQLNKIDFFVGNELSINVNEIDGEALLTFITGRMFDWPDKDLEIIIEIKNNNNEIRFIDSVRVDNEKIIKYSIPLCLKESDELVLLKLRFADGTEFDNSQIDKAFCINWAINRIK